MFVSVLYIKLLLSIYYFATIYCKINTAVMCVWLLFIGAQEQRGMNQSTVCVCVVRLLLVIHVKKYIHY